MADATPEVSGTSDATTDQVDPTATPGTDAESKQNNPEVDVDALRRDIAGAGDSASTKAELEAVRRATGHIPGIQSRLDRIEASLQTIDSVKDSAARFDRFLESLPEGFLSDRELANLRPTGDETVRQMQARLDAMQERLDNPTPPEPKTEDPQAAAARAAWDRATASVERYATSKGLDPTTIPDAEYERAVRANPGDPVAASLDLMRWIDTSAEAEKRRREKIDAGSGGSDNGEGGRSPRGNSAPLTLARMKTMTREELGKYTPEERMQALTAG
jgi:hypothetical protein